MRKLLLAALLSASTLGVFAQKIEDVKADVSKQKYTDAKSKIDQLAADPKNAGNSEVWFEKAVVYNNLAKANPTDATLQAAALDAMKRYFQLESGVKDEKKRFLLSTLEGHKTAFDLYSSQFNAGVQAYNAKNYEQSYKNFSNALDAFDMLSNNNLTNIKFDTTAVLYAGITAQNSKNLAGAAKYYGMIADKRIADTNYVDLYEFLVQYYMNNKDEANMNKYLALGRELYPNNKNWISYEIAATGNDKDKRMAKYQEILQKDPKNYEVALDYAAELFSQTYGGDPKKPGDVTYEAQKDALTKAIQRAIDINPTATANYIMTQHISNQIYDLQQQLNDARKTTAATKASAGKTSAKGATAKPAGVGKSQEYEKAIAAKFEDVFAYSTKAYDQYSKETNLKPEDKQNYKKVLNNLVDYYQYKKQPAKAAEYQAKLKTL